MKNETKQELQDLWLKNVIETHNCIEELNKLNKNKQKLIALVEGENPPNNIIELLKESEEEFERLLKKSERIKQEAIKLKELIKQIEEN